MNKCRLSIIVPVYNAEEYLDRCLVSILEQDFSSYEVILVDDGSTDSSPLICDRYSATDPRFRTIHKENGGVSSARNSGLDLAKGEYVMFVDSDDALIPDSLEMLFEHMTGQDFAVGGYNYFLAANFRFRRSRNRKNRPPAPCAPLPLRRKPGNPHSPRGTDRKSRRAYEGSNSRTGAKHCTNVVRFRANFSGSFRKSTKP